MKIKLLIAACLLLTGMTLKSTAQWTQVATNALDTNNGQMILLSDGRVLCHTYAGEPRWGSTDNGDIYDILTPDANGSYKNGTWSRTTAGNSWRYSFPSALLKDGRFYAGGGEYGTDGTQAGAHAEVYDPVSDSWSALSTPGAIISDGDCELLDNGKILQAEATDYTDERHNAFFDPVSNSYSTGPDCIGISNEAMWLKLPDNSILMTDMPRLNTSYTYTTPFTSERYIPDSNKWIADANVPDSLWDPWAYETGPATMLPDGRAWFMGSTGHTAYYTPSGNSTPGTWAAGPDMPNNTGMPDAPLSMMVNGHILYACSHFPTNGNNAPVPAYWYEFDYTNNGGNPDSGTYTQINAPQGGLSYNDWSQHYNLVNLPDGTVLCGTVNSPTYYIYTPSSGPLASGKPTINSYSQCGSLMLTGTKFNGISQGSAFGDENQSNSNYPIVRLTNGSNVYYARTFNWNSTGVQRGSKADTVYFTLPSGFPIGPTYNLVVVANGIASDPISVSDFTVFTPPTATASANPNPVCSNSILTLTGGPASMSNYAWTGPNSYNNGSQSPTISNPPPAAAGTYSLTVTDSHGCTGTATTAPVVVNTPPVITLNPTNFSAMWGDGVSFTANASGTPTPTVHWQLSTDGGGTYNNIPGAIYTTYSFDCVTLTQNGYMYRAVFENTCGDAISNAATLTVTKKTVTGTITINPNPQQYSDTVNISITIPNGFTCGVQAATGAGISIGTQFMGTITFSTSGKDLVGVLYDVVLLEPTPFGTAPTGQMAPGPHTVTASLIGVNSNYSITNPTTILAINPEDARVIYTGAINSGTVSATSHNAIVTLSATIQDITAVPADPAYDPFPGDIRNAKVTFINRNTNTVIASNIPVGLVTPDTKTGTATYNWNVTITGSSQTFSIGIIVTNYYTRNSSADNTAITVMQPIIGNFVTANGYLILHNSSGFKAGDAGSENDFSAQVKYNNGQGQMQGSLSTTILRTETDGLQHTYQVSSNTINSLAALPNGANGIASLSGDVTITDVTKHHTAVVIDGNASLLMVLVDLGGNGKTDSAAITIWNKSGGLWFASNWNVTKTIEQVISQGNIQVHSNNAPRIEEETVLPDNSSACMVYPNPNNGQFSLGFNASSKAIYNVRLIDLTGRVVFSESFTAVEGINNRNYDFTRLANGLYLMAVQNDEDYRLIKILIQN